MQSVIYMSLRIFWIALHYNADSNMSMFNLSMAPLYIAMPSIIYMLIMNIVMLCTVI